ncbi:MAG: 3-carboxy-cis,cis-muconate cycloisomerase [Gammaproteobacteria bacterium]
MSSSLLSEYLGAPKLANCFAAMALLENMLAFEVALARAQAELGLIPESAAAAIAAAARATEFDLEALRKQTAESSNPAIPLVRALTANVTAVDAAAGHCVHLGSTSQDVMDSALMLSCRAALQLLDGDLVRLESELSALASGHRGTLMPARTLSQQAGPTTLGVKAAGWLQGLVNGHTRLRQLHTALPLQFSGATGTLAAYGDRGAELTAAVAAMLGLRAVPPWQTERSAIREMAAMLAGLAATAGKIATDLLLMMQTEVGELREAPAPGRGGSSALPHKRNPVASMAVSANARRAPGLLAMVFAAFDQTHERAAGAWHAEFMALTELFEVTGGALLGLQRALRGLEIDQGRMLQNLAFSRGVIMSEAVTAALRPTIGQSAAQGLVKRAVADAAADDIPLSEALVAMSEIAALTDRAALDRALNPASYLGMADHIIDEALAAAARLSGEDAG